MARRFVAGLSRRRFGFDPGSVHVRFVVDIVALGQVFPRVLRYFPVSIILPIFHINLHVSLTERTDGRSLGTSQKSNALSEIGEDCIRRQFHFFNLQGFIAWVYNPRPASRMCKLCIYYKNDSNVGISEYHLLLFLHVWPAGQPTIGMCHFAIKRLEIHGKIVALSHVIARY
jgi:phage shock protein PspC (stress-responsive transcriptional regulator)